MRPLPLFAIALTLIFSSSAFADPQDVSNDISRQMISPYCPGVTLHDCPSEASRRLRMRITDWAEDGMTRDQIWQRLENEFGDGMRANPPAEGSGLWAWLLPVAAVVAGIATASILALRWSRRSEGDARGADISPEQRRRIELELAAIRDRQG